VLVEARAAVPHHYRLMALVVLPRLAWPG